MRIPGSAGLHDGFLELRRDNAPGDLAVPGLGDRLENVGP